ncbi:enoyl-CoA hydratase-related protein [Paenibacillus sp. KS1]|uniref:enoyl-CoA hydratase-related protein n=1 Tax=Paenibacillus sp. KS1 TaxID=1849249 RepID=UPI00158635DC|nr:enoyl-CoA hydratase-related protein [Paenibacillus sp. KS1]
MEKGKSYTTISLRSLAGWLKVTLDRPLQNNSLNATVLHELHSMMDDAEQDPSCRIILIEGHEGVFCTGMDLKSIVDESGAGTDAGKEFCELFMHLLKRISASPKIVVAFIDGVVMAGGVGVAAACDFVLATSRAKFNLSELLWGLLPSMVIPYLIRRIGYQRAYTMTLSTLPVSAEQAYGWGLVDEVTERPEEYIHKLSQRVVKMDEGSIKNAKEYFRKMWLISDSMERTAIAATSGLLQQDNVMQALYNYVRHDRFPWEKHDH